MWERNIVINGNIAIQNVMGMIKRSTVVYSAF